MTRLYDIKIMTLYEYEARMYAYKLKQVDVAEDIHMQSWLSHEITATKQKGKNSQEYVYKTFAQFFDREKYENQAKGIHKEVKKIPNNLKKKLELIRKANERR